jgi:hypothetical protein
LRTLGFTVPGVLPGRTAVGGEIDGPGSGGSPGVTAGAAPEGHVARAWGRAGTETVGAATLTQPAGRRSPEWPSTAKDSPSARWTVARAVFSRGATI